MTREERLHQLFEALNEGRITEEAYDEALINIDNFEYDEDYERKEVE